MEVHRSFLSSLTWRLSRNVTPAALHGTLNRFDYALASDFALDLKFLWRRLAQTSLVSQAICARTQLSPSFAAENSERHVKGAAVARRGPLRDLDPNNVLPTPATQPSLKVANSDDDLAITDEDEASREPPRSTRATRSGRQKVNYDMKYHPMDEVTRPKRAAKRIPASCPPKTSIKIDLETSDASSNIDLDFPSGDDESELESKDSDIELVRKPDPRATRHSARSEARKAVNYSRKHHPQDHGLPGFQRRAKRIKLEHSDAVRKKSYAGGGLDDDDIGNFQQRSDSLKGSDTGVEGHVDEQKGTIDDLPIHSQSLGGSEEGRPDPKLCASFKNDSEAASMEDAGIANSTDNEFVHGDRMNESGVEQFGDMDYLGLFPSETHGNPEVQTSSLAASPKKEMISVEEQVQLNRADASLTIVKPYFSGYQGYVLNPSAVPFELSRATMLDHAPSQPQDFDQPAIGSPFSGADTTSVNGIPKDSQSALKSDQGTAPQASLALTSSACFEESSVNQTRASLSCSSNTLSAVDDSTPGVLAPSLILDDAKEGRGSMQSDIPGSAQPQQPSVEDADVHELFSKYASDTHGSHENGNDLLSPLLLSLGQNGSPAIQATTGDSELPSTCAQSFASAEDANEVPPSGQGDH
ncbi:hypothetical protein D0869_04601 [Hortaea werneckii]|uniref:Uncharacterized protein n=1 Tax=Hortaea werneckii TaxID=91943 RepID=A0A3M6X1S2_HORWE|nr:hypothetical protein KC324_g11801 [Hortaea werneckii]KAI7572322.1 hypothetical protein KC316_g11948 [Hortaea werneckii]RMX84386.1 hypothetical protein D0869_04601 [Hortaea werneckii]RMY09685.1 hypothetical protein D0868_04104 [Hortaea werneckii]